MLGRAQILDVPARPPALPREFIDYKTSLTTHLDPLRGCEGNQGLEFSHALPIFATSSHSAIRTSSFVTLDCTTSRRLPASASAKQGPEEGDLVLRCGRVVVLRRTEVLNVPPYLRRNPPGRERSRGTCMNERFIIHIFLASSSTAAEREENDLKGVDARAYPTQRTSKALCACL